LLKTIRVVDDEADINMALREVLEENKFTVDPYEALLVLDNSKPNFYDLLSLDIKLLEINGFSL
jgi:DNA-binding response OmpR family regulator